MKSESFTKDAPEGYKWAAAEEGTQKLVPVEYVAQIGDVKYETLEAAFAAVKDGETITLLKDCAGNGIKAPQGKFTTGVTVDFANFTYTVDGETVGSTGTETNGFQLLKDNKITFKNGTITSEKAKILVQNYSDLTLQGMTLTLNNQNYDSGYTLSNNNGNVVVDGSTINANTGGGFAFDCCRYSSYPSVNVTVKGESVINGNVEVYASGSDAKDGFKLMLEAGTMSGNIVLDATAKAAMAATPEKALVMKSESFTKDAPEGYKWAAAEAGTQKLVPVEYVAQIGDVKFETLQAALDAAEAADTENFVIELLADAELDITAWDGTKNPLSIGTVNTQSITINGNDHKLTFNHKNSDWNNVATMNDAQTKLVLNNMTISNAGYDNSTWNSHDINFNCAVELNNVTSDKALAFKNDATLKNVIITDNSGDIYAVWISPRGQEVDIDGLTINCKRGIKIDDEYVDTPSNATLNIANATFNTTKKSAILVKNNGETTINAGEGINIENAAADTVNPVWVDEDKAEEFYKVTVTGANVVPESKESDYVACLMKGEQRWGYYKGTDALSRTIAQVEEGWSIKLHQTTTEAVEVSKPLVITKNGFTADNVTAGEGFVREETDDEIIIKEKAEEVLVELIDGKPYPYPEGKECTSVTYKRTFGNTNMQAWYVPFDYTITAEDNENFTFYKISMIASAAEAGEVGNTETIYIYYTTLAEGSKLSANRPYFVKPKQSGSYEFTATGIDKVYPEDNSSRLNLRTTEYNYDFYGNLQSLVGKNEHEFLAMKSGEICWNKPNTTLGSYRWYIKPTPRTDYSDYGNINFVIVENDGDTDQISTNALDNLEIEGIYTLGGVKVDNPVKGVNIIRYKNGQTKKLYIK